MTFEQLDNQKKDREKKEEKKQQEKNQQFWLEKQVLRETSSLLHDLALKISQDFGIDISEAKNLIQWSTLWDLDSLKWHLHNGEKIDFSDFQKALTQAQKSIESLSKQKRESLRDSLEEERYAPEKFEYKINKKFVSPNLLHRAQNPQSIGDHTIGLWLGLIDSTEAVILFTYGLWRWILLTPYHIYLILTGQAKYKGFRKI